MYKHKKKTRPKDKNEFHQLACNLFETHFWLNSLLTKRLKPYDLSLPQFSVLSALKDYYPKPVTIAILSENTFDEFSNVSRLVDRLRAKRLIHRRTNEADSRALDLLISPKGIKLLQKLNKVPTLLEKQKTLNEKEAKKLNLLIGKLRGKN